MKKIYDEIDIIEFLEDGRGREKLAKYLMEYAEYEEIDLIKEIIEKAIKKE